MAGLIEAVMIMDEYEINFICDLVCKITEILDNYM